MLTATTEAIGRLFSPAKALDAAGPRRNRTYDPELADLFVARGPAWFDRPDKLEPWDAVLDLKPEPRRMLDGEVLDKASRGRLRPRPWRRGRGSAPFSNCSRAGL